MQWRLIINLWIVMFALLPMTAVAEVTNAVISVDGMFLPLHQTLRCNYLNGSIQQLECLVHLKVTE